ncbi:peroxisomal biogenesis factor 11 [Pterulicium gracile]|uniref:Peroxisomal biogenesis factor 11 n=1 Tax=Pterulicium gracile TaxID=1884261 RepID=A0A5C3QX78_9AGAR|nr:peroxisomal biogenesis factor 11 [Pterula gracilis]
MASIASHLVFHPAVSQSLKLGNTTVGRDKLYRAVQNLARFLSWYYLSRGEKDPAARWTALKSHLASARKLLRLGKPVEHLQAALRASTAPGPALEQVTAAGRQLAYFLYLSYDAFVWANSVKLYTLTPDTAEKVAKRSNRFWLAGIILSIVNSFIKASRIRREVKAGRHLTTSEKVSTTKQALKATDAATRHQLTMDLLDLWLPATALNLVNIPDGVVGILGFTTSVMALRKQWGTLGGK